MKLKFDREQFTKLFLTPVSKISNECSIYITNSNIYTLVGDDSRGIILYCNSKINTSVAPDASLKINIKDITKIERVFKCISDDEVELDLDDNLSVLKYSSDEVSFKLHLINENVVKRVALGYDKLSKLTFDTEFKLPTDKLPDILKGRLFTSESNKIYLYTKNSCVYGELTDKSSPDLDSITYKLAESYTGDHIVNPLPFGLEFLGLISGVKSPEINIKVNNTYKIIMFEITDDDNTLKYIISTYTK